MILIDMERASYLNKPENPFQTMTSQKIMKLAKIVKIDKLLK